jgi:hypothetical protein
MQRIVSVFQRLRVARNITSQWGFDIQRQEASCNKTWSESRITTHNDVRQDQRTIEQDRQNTLSSTLTNTHTHMRVYV